MRKPTRILIAALAMAGLTVAACGSDDEAAETTVTTAAPTTDAPTTDAPTTDAPTTDAPTTDAPTTDPAIEGEIVVFAARSLTGAYEEIGAAFSAANPGATVTFNFGASSALVTQLTEGAPADVYASADQANMTKLTDAGGNGGAPVVFATNSLQIIVEAGNPLGITGVADLAKPDVLYVTCAPEVPIGKYGAEVLANASVELTPVSLEEDVQGIVTKVVEGEADAGIVYATDVIAQGDKATGVEIPADINVIATYPVVDVKEAGNPAGAVAFIDFVLSDAGQAILASYGFSAP